MTSNYKLEAMPIDKFKGNASDYLSYINKIFIINNVDVNNDKTYVKEFLKIQHTQKMKSCHFDHGAQWTKQVVIDFCKSLMSDLPNRPMNKMISLSRAYKYKNKTIKAYILQLKSLISSMTEAEKEKIVSESDENLRNYLCEIKSFSFQSVVTAIDEYTAINEFRKFMNLDDIYNEQPKFNNKFNKPSYNKHNSSDIYKNNKLNHIMNPKNIKLPNDTNSTTKVEQSNSQKSSSLSWDNRDLTLYKTLIKEQFSNSPLVYEAIKLFCRDVVVMLDSEATCNIILLELSINDTSSNFIGFLDAHVSIIGNSTNVKTRFYVSKANFNSNSGGMCKQLGISVDRKISEQLEKLSITQPTLVDFLINNPSTYDDSILQLILTTSIPLKEQLKRKLYRSYRPKGDGYNFLANTLRKEKVEEKIKQSHSSFLTSPTHVINEN
uniref:Uncharacterized protein n=1 Tax=Strongyloides stercoralis TaxID=6248 RepID=A0AAF5I390_STRER